MKELYRVPRLRFPEFEGNWKEQRLKSLFSVFRSGNSITSNSIYETGKYPVYGGNGLRGYTDNYTHSGFYLLVGRQGALCGNINRSVGKAFISEHAIAGKADKNSDTEWLAQKLDYLNLNRLSESSAQPGLSVTKLLRLKLTVPQLSEQQKIASFLSSVDKKIDQLQQKKSLLEQYKKGVMQQLFSQELRFKDENGDNYPIWEKKKYKEIYTFYSTNSLSRDKLNYENGEVQNIHYGDIHTKFSTLFDIEKELVPFVNYDVNIDNIKTDNYLKKGDLLIADASEDYKDIGKTIEVVNLANKKVISGLHTFHARPNKFKMAVGFAGFMLQTWYVRKQVMKIAQGTKVLGLATGRLGEIKLNIPCIEEQTKIANFLSAIDKKIESVNAQIETTQEFKKGLLQQMFV
ncbi:restriction endonuclease subunit S [Gelidibacter sp. F63206]|uniref:restriction endonuclease subunit S n=1 Tax=Gelidibacter sp. F63206 TaxID=2926425 RepID=UPI001FF128D6|nr:restriction endonuclease subunit S [Gelidibacter sp. F63206]MCK0114975.1 restriction endonuclease subunit S [Gelidibacter sp. F63206]